MYKRAMLILFSAALVEPSTAFAQSRPVRERGPVSVVFDGGLAAGSGGAGPAVGGRLTFDLSDRVAIEGAGTWAGRGSGADAGSVTASLLINLTRADRKTVPYAAIGVGWYRAMFGMGDRRFFGMMQGYTGSGMWTEPWSGSTWDVSQMPMFYLERMGTVQLPADGRWGMYSFGDPAVSVGGGVRIDVSERVYVRPEFRALVALADGRSSTTGMFTVGLGYRF